MRTDYQLLAQEQWRDGEHNGSSGIIALCGKLGASSSKETPPQWYGAEMHKEGP